MFGELSDEKDKKFFARMQTRKFDAIFLLDVATLMFGEMFSFRALLVIAAKIIIQ
jgi:hypothetical protein